MTIDRWIVDAASRQPDKPALIFNHKSISYAQLSDLITAKVTAFKHAGVVHGDRIAWYGLNHPDVFVLLFACARVGAILVPLNWRLAEPEVAAIVENCEPTLVFYDEHFAKQALAVPNVTAVPAAAFNEISPTTQSAHNTPTTDTVNHPHVASLDDPVLLVYTSGSTGRPKGAVLSQKSLVSNARMSVHAHKLNADDTALVSLPLFHVGGMNILPTPAFSVGATVLLHERFDPDRICKDLANATLAIVVPTVLQAMMNSQYWASVNFESIRGMSIGSTDVPISLIEQMHARNIPVIQVYGATETGPFAIYQTLDEAKSTIGSIGRAGCDCQIRLVMNGKDADVGKPGEIWVKGDNVLLEYWKEPELTSQLLVDGWLRTGDVATLDDSGLYWFTDRIKHVIISGGENIYPSEIERILREVPGIKEVAVVGIPDAKWGEIPVVVLVSDKVLESDDVLTPLNGQIARYKLPKRVVFVEALPRNAMGKIVAADVRDLIN